MKRSELLGEGERKFLKSLRDKPQRPIAKTKQIAVFELAESKQALDSKLSIQDKITKKCFSLKKIPILEGSSWFAFVDLFLNN